MARHLVGVLALVGAAGAFGVAEGTAAVSKGQYLGKTEGGRPVQFKVLSDSKTLIKFITELPAQCEGERQFFGTVFTQGYEKFPISRTGRFTLKPKRGQSTHDYTVRGTIKGKKATGTVRVIMHVDERGVPDAGGNKCDTGTVRWTAKTK
jgi:hypothetical protein